MGHSPRPSTYADNGLFVVTLVVTDETGLSAADSLLVTVNNVAPTVSAGLDQNANEGGTVSLDPATFIDPSVVDMHTAVIDWGDGNVEPGTVDQIAGTVNGSHMYGDNGPYSVTITVTDDDGGQDSDTFTVSVTK